MDPDPVFSSAPAVKSSSVGDDFRAELTSTYRIDERLELLHRLFAVDLVVWEQRS